MNTDMHTYVGYEQGHAHKSQGYHKKQKKDYPLFPSWSLNLFIDNTTMEAQL